MSHTAKTIRWVAKVLCLDGVTRKDAPTNDAAACLEWVREDTANEDTFCSTMFPRILPAVRPQLGTGEPAISDEDMKKSIEKINTEVAQHMKTFRAEQAEKEAQLREEVRRAGSG